jgi:hypothetical protein
MKIALDGVCISLRLTGAGRYFQVLLGKMIPSYPGTNHTFFLSTDRFSR